MKTCSIENCGLAHQAKGFCDKHYRRFKKTGDPTSARKLASSTEEAFTIRSIQTETGCYRWDGAVDTTGYAIMADACRKMGAHRYAWERVNGPIPDGKVIDHICGTRSCTKVEHLRITTQKQNCENRSALSANNTSGYRGVSRAKRSGKWTAAAKHNGQTYALYGFDTAAEANEAVIALRNELFTHNDRDRATATPQSSPAAA